MVSNHWLLKVNELTRVCTIYMSQIFHTAILLFFRIPRSLPWNWFTPPFGRRRPVFPGAGIFPGILWVHRVPSTVPVYVIEICFSALGQKIWESILWIYGLLVLLLFLSLRPELSLFFFVLTSGFGFPLTGDLPGFSPAKTFSTDGFVSGSENKN